MDEIEKGIWETVRELIRERKNEIIKIQSYERAAILRNIERQVVSIINGENQPNMIVEFFKEEFIETTSPISLDELNIQYDMIKLYIRTSKLKKLLD